MHLAWPVVWEDLAVSVHVGLVLEVGPPVFGKVSLPTAIGCIGLFCFVMLAIRARVAWFFTQWLCLSAQVAVC